MSVTDVVVASTVGLLTWRLVVYWSKLKTVGNLPGIRPAFSAFSLPGILVGLGLDFPWLRRYDLYETYGSEAISIVPYLWGLPLIYTSSIDVVRQIVGGGSKSNFIKPVTASQSLLLFGDNLAAKTGGEEWRKHRRIMGPAFNNNTYSFVWQESVRIFREMTRCEGWDDKEFVTISAVQSYTFKYALFIIAACGFGLPFAWDEPPSDDDGKMTLQEALGTVTSTGMLRMASPRWLYPMSKKLQTVDQAYKTLGGFMQSQVNKRKTEIKSAQGGDIGRTDVFSRLVQASELEGKLGLDDEELIGNTFVLLFAGHDTSAHTLAATLGFLALYPDEQDLVYQQIRTVLGDTGDPAFEDYPTLDKVSAAFHEALRMFPAGSLMIREATEDIILDIPTDKGICKTPLPKGVTVVADVVGVQYNPRHYPNPEKFQPSRWYSSSESKGAEGETNQTAIDLDNFTAFSIGPRACIGRKFATVESVAFLTLLLRDWKVDPLFKDDKETKEEWKERILQARMVTTLGVRDVPIQLTRRR